MKNILLTGTSKALPTHVSQSLSSIMTSYLELQKTRETEKTKRLFINKAAEVTIEKIRTHREIIIHALDQSFEERRHVITQQFLIIEEALKSGKSEIAAKAIDSMVDLVKSSPFKEISELSKNLERDDFVLRLE